MDPGLCYREAAAAGAKPVRLVVLLYEQAIEDLRRARAALQRGDVEQRTHHINHAILVLGHLEASLDKAQGGSVAAHLERFYAQVRLGLTQAQFHQSPSALEQQIADLVAVREAWDQLERAAESEVARGGDPGNAPSQSSLSDWST